MILEVLRGSITKTLHLMNYDPCGSRKTLNKLMYVRIVNMRNIKASQDSTINKTNRIGGLHVQERCGYHLLEVVLSAVVDPMPP